jgi:hypothetical protein
MSESSVAAQPWPDGMPVTLSKGVTRGRWLRQNPAELRRLRQLRPFFDKREIERGDDPRNIGLAAQSLAELDASVGVETMVSEVITGQRSDPRHGAQANEGLQTVCQLCSKLLSRVVPQSDNGFV